MDINKQDIISKVRTAIDEILPAGMIDTFSENLDSEIWQAVRIASEQLCLELPRDLIVPKAATGVTASKDNAILEGEGVIAMPSDYLTLYELRMDTWKRSVVSLIIAGTDEAGMQANEWTCGTPWKPRVMEEHDGSQAKLRYWTVADEKHNIKILTYIPQPSVNADDTLSVPLKSAAERYIIYRAGALVLAAKKESVLAEQMNRIAQGTPVAVEE